MKFFDLFAGIGGFRMGLESLGHHCVGFCEIDKFARTSYKAIYDTEGDIEFHDIRNITTDAIRGIGRVDIICGGFPCQAFSIAGNRRGFEDTRGTLFFEVARFASILRPKYLFLENVKGLLSHDNGTTFETILRTLDELGYDVEWQVLNSKDFGVPQNRERVFLIGHLRGAGTRNVFPIRGESPTADLLKPKRLGNLNPSGRGMNGEVYQVDALSPTVTTNKGEGSKIAIPVLTPDRLQKRQNGRRFKENGEPMFTLTSQDRHGIVIAGRLPSARQQSSRVYATEGLAPTLSTMQGGDQEPKIIQKARGYNNGGSHSISPTLSSHSWHENNLLQVYDFYNKSYRDEVGTLTTTGHRGFTTMGTFGITEGYRIRKLTPRECWRLQGFPDWAFDRAKAVNSNSQLYKQAGNSVTVPVIQAIAKNFKEGV
ncbi:DNA methylase [Streptococcus gallolyticus]|uniref:Cytosine-specific methyltransferase n=1 Tax=Streptococcus gallolyticus TaxID=315405 RepID=A0AA94M3X9_9STRE|nr:DNA cytosine methyltransferase [Streptococcus gallolyticus]AQP42475.1 DNA methylase [Streptococcus gallolyticus subsp. gallolyticus DSM 16831]SQG79779.1 DNA methylase [Streptococcus gallolyticus]